MGTDIKTKDGILLRNVPDGTSDAVIKQRLDKIRAEGAQPPAAQAAAPIAGAGQPVSAYSNSSAMTPVRSAEFFGRGFFDSLGDLAAAPLELSASAMRGLGLTNQRPGLIRDKIGEAGRAVGGVLNAPLNAALDASGAALGPNEPVGSLEKGSYGAGRGAGDAASFMIPGGALLKTAKAGGTAANVGKALVTQPTTQAVAGGTGGFVGQETDSPMAGIAASMLTPSAMSAARRLITPVRQTLAPETQRLIKEAEKIGIKLTAGQKTDSRPLQSAESSFQQLPFTAGPQRKIYDQQITAFNSAALKKAGIEADNAAPEVISGGFKTLGARFDDLVKQTTIYVDRKFIKDIEDVVAESTRKMGADDAKILTAWGDDAKQLAKALDDPTKSNAASRVIIEGDVYKKTATGLRTAIRGANGDLKTNLIALMNKLDDAVERSMGKEVRLDWADVRGKYRNLLIIDKAVSGGTQATRNSGDIPFGAFKSAVTQSDKSGFGRGRGDLNTLARVGDLLADKIPNSGTAERSRMINMLSGSGFGTGGLTAGSGMVAGLDPQTSIMLGAGAASAQLALPRMIQALMNSKWGQSYLTNTVAGRSGPTEELLAKIFAAQGISPANEQMQNALGAR